MQRSVDANSIPVNAARQVCFICETRAALNTPQEEYSPGIPLWRRAAIWPFAAIVRLWLLTIRIRMPAEDLGVITFQGQPTVFILWHNRLFMTSEIVRRYRGGHPIYGLVSPSNDGAWLAAFYAAVGMGAVRGSSSRLGREAASALVELLRSGFDAGITPDGPRGPAYELKPGALIVARRARTRVVLVGVAFESSWRLASWDGFHIPKPFSSVHMRFETVQMDELADRDEAARLLGRRLAELNPDRRPTPVRKRE